MSGYGKIYESSYWGVGVCENTIGWGSSYKSIANCTDASFSYPQDSYPTNGVNPTPTITGDAGGTFTATPSGLTLNASTGEITLSTSTVNSYTIRYTLPDATFAEQSMQITAPPFSSTRSFSFDGVNDYFDVPSFTTSGNDLTISFWFKDGGASGSQYIFAGNATNQIYHTSNTLFYARINGSTKYIQTDNAGVPAVLDGNWHHMAITKSGSTVSWYIDGNSYASLGSGTTGGFTLSRIGAYTTGVGPLNASLDEVAIWESALTSGNIATIYGSGTPSDLSTLNPLAWYRCGE